MKVIVFILLSASVLSGAVAAPRKTVSSVQCQTVADCWLNEEGKPVARPKSKQGMDLPRGNCGDSLLWLRNRLGCENQVCVARHIGDKC